MVAREGARQRLSFSAFQGSKQSRLGSGRIYTSCVIHPWHLLGSGRLRSEDAMAAEALRGGPRRRVAYRPRGRSTGYETKLERERRWRRFLPWLESSVGVVQGVRRRRPAVEAGGVRGGIRRSAPQGFWSRWLDAVGPGGAGGRGSAAGAAPAAANRGSGAPVWWSRELGVVKQSGGNGARVLGGGDG